MDITRQYVLTNVVMTSEIKRYRWRYERIQEFIYAKENRQMALVTLYGVSHVQRTRHHSHSQYCGAVRLCLCSQQCIYLLRCHLQANAAIFETFSELTTCINIKCPSIKWDQYQRNSINHLCQIGLVSNGLMSND